MFTKFWLTSWCFRRKLEKKQEGDDVPKQVPHTLESLREKDETMLANVDDDEKLEVRKCISIGLTILCVFLSGKC